MAKKKTETVEAAPETQEALSPDQITAVLDAAQQNHKLTDRERDVIICLSSQFHNMKMAQVADRIGKNQWQTYNVRRDGVRKVAATLGVEDPEDVFPLLGLKRGHRMPERHTRYFERKAEPEDTDDDDDEPDLEVDYPDDPDDAS